MFALPSVALLQGAAISIPSPDRFPWAVDKSAHLGRRRIVPLASQAHPSGFNLAALDRALDAVMRSPEDAGAMRAAARNSPSYRLLHAAPSCQAIGGGASFRDHSP